MKRIISLFICIIALFSLSSCKKNERTKVKFIDISLTNEEYAFAIKKGNSSLKDDFDNFLDTIKQDGRFDEILNKYFSDQGEKIGYPKEIGTVENNENKFVVATNCPFVPFEYIGEDGLIYGIDIEIAALYAKEKGLELVVKDIPFTAILNDVNNGYSDIGMAGITVDEVRLQSNDFTKGYFQASQKLIVSVDNHDFDECKTLEDVEKVLNEQKGKKIGYQEGTVGNWYVVGDEDWGFTGLVNCEHVKYQNAHLAVDQLSYGNIYGVVVDEYPAQSIVKSINESIDNMKSEIEIFISTVGKPQFKEQILKGLLNTLLIAVLGLLIGILIGTVIAIIKVAPKYKLINRVLNHICNVYVSIFRGTPIVIQLLIAYYVIPRILGLEFVSLNVAIVVFGLNSSAYVSEIMRSGVNSVDKGQLEAARAVGLSYNEAMIKIVIPQAIKNILPTLGNEFISLIKETSVVSFITVIDLYTAFNSIAFSTHAIISSFLIMALIYLLLVGLITLLVKLLERGLSKSDRNN